MEGQVQLYRGDVDDRRDLDNHKFMHGQSKGPSSATLLDIII